LRGFLWYQGESDVERHSEYAELQIALVRDLRAHFAQGAPFLFVELAGFRGGAAWPFLREAQQRASSEPGSWMASARDLGDADDIHPRNKQEVGRRLSLLARDKVYGQPVPSSGPVLSRMAIEGGTVRIWFASETPLRSRSTSGLGGFELAGADGRYHSAQAKLDVDHVQLTCPTIAQPVSARYAFSDTGEGDLENSAGLPALSFRTDTFAGPRSD
jgi:sialate O-acetylesterase